MPQAKQEFSRWLWIAPVILLYLISLPLPAVQQAGLGAPSSSASGIVRKGWECVASTPLVVMAPAWWANPLWICGILAFVFGKRRLAWFSAFAATLFALSVFAFGAFPPDNFQYADFHIGYYVWLTSMLTLLLITQFVRGDIAIYSSAAPLPLQ